MILTCPDCATRYKVDEQRLGPQGRTVRCASCGYAWRAEAPPAEPLELKPAKPAAEPPKPAPATVHGQFRAKVEAQRRTREAVAAGVVWGVLAAGFAVLLIAAVVFRTQVVRIWPRTAGAYAAVRLPVNPLGVAPENVQAATGLEHGRMALVVTGLQRNIDSAPRHGAPMRVAILDKAGHPLATKVLRPSGALIPPGESRPFKVSFYDPPLTAATVGVDFVFDLPPPPFQPRAHRPAQVAQASQTLAQPAGQTAAQAPASPLKLRGASSMPQAPAVGVRPAEPLPADSRYALPSAARADAELAPKLRARD
jgi:predicted Zn finger-like uncharacterized protein